MTRRERFDQVIAARSGRAALRAVSDSRGQLKDDSPQHRGIPARAGSTRERDGSGSGGDSGGGWADQRG
jgi:hypothetical protein